MANTFKFGNGNWAVKDGSVLAYNDENNNFKPLPFDFTRDSIATRVNKDGLIEVVPNNMPRIDFTDNTSGHLLLEPSRTNNLPYSEQFDDVAWSKGDSTVAANQAISPDGSQTADLLQLTSASGNVFDGVGGSGDYAFSVFAKYVDAQYIRLRSTGSYAYFDIQNGSVGSTTNVSSTKIEDYGNGWYRCTVVGNNTNSLAQIFVSDTDGSNTGTGSVYIWGAMFESGSYATSYIPTSGSTETRQADICNGSGNSGTFNDSEGVLYAELSIDANDGNFRFLSISDGTNTNAVWIYYRSDTNQINFRVIVGGVSSFDEIYTINNATINHKLAIKYKTNYFSAYVNGVKVLTDNSGATFSSNVLNDLDFNRPDGINNFYGKVKELTVINEALTDEQLQLLTTP